MVASSNKRKGESLNSPLPSKKVGFKTVAKRGKVRRKGELSASPLPSTKTIVSDENFVEMSNPYETLNNFSEQQIEDASSPGTSISAKKQRVPPIVVSVCEFAGFRQEILNSIRGIKVSFQIARKGDCRVLPETLKDRDLLLKYLTEKKHKFFTYDDRSARLFKVVLKGLSSDDKSPDEIKTELNLLLGFTPVQVIKMKKRTRSENPRQGISQEFYLVHFNKSDLNNLKYLEKAKKMFLVQVTWEHFRKPGGNFQNPTQCRQCQGWGHGTKHCHMDAKCMICGGSSHAKDNCPVREDTRKFKCTNCGGNHKSNFWDCPIRKKVVESRARQMNGNASRTRNSAGRISNNTNSSINDRLNNFHTARTYSPEVVNHQTNLRANNLPSSSGVSNISNFVQTNRATYAHVAAGKQNSNNSYHQTSNSENARDSGMSASDFDFLSEQLQQMIDAMFKTQTMAEAVQVGVKFTNKIVIGLRFGNGSK